MPAYSDEQMQQSLRLLHIEDNPADEYLVHRLLGNAPGRLRYEIETAQTAHAIKLALQRPFDVCLMDYDLGAETALDLLRQFRASDLAGPVILLTGHDSLKIDQAALELGVADYISKHEVTAGLLDRTIRYARRQFEDQRKLDYLAHHDPLTGLLNRQAFVDRLQGWLDSGAYDADQIFILYIDLDGFKKINDSWGHEAGDRILCHAARSLETSLRKSDLIARHGGDEFIAAVAHTGRRHIQALTEKLLAGLGQPIRQAGQVVNTSGSVGLARASRNRRDVAEIIRQADQAMFAAKRNGGNQFCLYVPDAPAMRLETDAADASPASAARAPSPSDAGPGADLPEGKESATTRADEAARLAGMGFWGIDSATGRYEFDANWRHITGMAQDLVADREFIAKHFRDEDRDRILSGLTATLEQGADFDEAFAWRRPDNGKMMFLRARGRPRWRNGEIVGLGGVALDDTVRHLQESELAELRERHGLGMSAARVGTWTWFVDREFVETDDHVERVFGVGHGGFDGSMDSWKTLIHPEDAPAAITSMYASVESGEAFETRYRVPLPDGSIRQIATRGEPVEFGDDGRVLRVAGASWDVSAEMQARREAESAIDRMHEAARASGAGFWEISADSKTCRFDEHWQQHIVGLPSGEITLDFVARHVDPADLDDFRQQLQSVLAQGGEVNIEFGFTRPLDGQHVYLRVRGRARYDQNGQITGVGGVSLDETEQRQARAAAGTALARMEEATRLSAVGFWELDAETGLSRYGPNWLRHVGVPPMEDMEMEYMRAHFHADDIPAFERALQSVLEHGGDVDVAARWLRPDNGELMYIRARGSARRDAAGNIIGVGGVATDETHAFFIRRELEALRERVDRNLRAARVNTWSWHIKPDLLEADAHAMEVFGGAPEDADPTLEEWLALVHQDDRDKVRQCILRCAEGEPFEVIYRVPSAEGELVWLMTRGDPIDRDEQGNILRLGGITSDVSAEMRARERVDQAAEAGRLGFWRFDSEAEEFDLDHNWRRIIGYPADAPLPDTATTLELIHPDDRSEFERKLRQALSDRTPFEHDYRAVHMQSREVLNFRVRGNVLEPPQQHVMAGYVMETTDIERLRAQAGETLTLLETALRAVQATAFSAYPEDNRIQFVGPIQEMLGLPETARIEQIDQLLEHIHADDRAQVAAAMKVVSSDETPLDFSFRVVHDQTAATRWMHLRARPSRASEEATAHLIGVLVDETEPMQRRRELDALRARYDLGMRTAGVGNWSYHVDEDCLEIDDIALSLLELAPGSHRCSAADYIGYCHPDDQEGLTEAFASLTGSDELVEIRYRRSLSDGRVRWLLARGKTYTRPDGARVAEGALWDVSEIMALTEALERSNADLDEFAYVASHDLREPLRGLHNFAQFLAADYSDKLDGEGRHMVDSLGRLAQRLDDLISDLLHFSRVGRTELAVADTDLSEVLRDMLGTLAYSLEQQAVDVRVPKPLPIVHCDRVRVGELLRNLITNAAKYNDKDEKWIEIGHADGVFHVRDNGIGIPVQHHDKVFSIFQRLHTREAYGGGTGAGLTIVQRIVERHGGQIWLESEPGTGTTFRFTLGAALHEKAIAAN